MAGKNLLASKAKNRNAPKTVFKYRYRVGGKSKTGEFNSVSNKAALRYCGFNAKGEAMKGGGLLKNKLPRGAKITHLESTGRKAKKP